jgi:hypothetical protein
MLKTGFFARAVKGGKTQVEADELWKSTYGKPSLHMINVPNPHNQSYERHSDDCVSRILKYFY